MSIIHVNQLKSRLKEIFTGLIDLSDCKDKSADDMESIFLSRALAAYTVHHLTGMPPSDAATTVVDGYDDNGIDVIAYDETQSKLLLVQSKWSKEGKGEPDNGSVKKFVSGIGDLLSLNFDRFNSKVQKRVDEIEDILTSPTTKIVAILAHTGTSKLSIHSQRDFDDLKKEVNDAGEILEVEVLDQSKLHRSLTESLNNPISADLTIRYWGKRQEPSYAIYGQISASDLAKLWSEYKERLLAKNLRGSLGEKTDVNSEIRETLINAPEKFWYFNNGITAIASKVKKLAIGGGDNDLGVFHCEDVYVVNGAQTISTIGRFVENEPDRPLSKCFVQIRLISLEEANEDFGDEITKTNNRQNRIDSRDFVSQDTEQKRLKSELAIDGVQYVIMRSDEILSGASSFDLQESTTALACASLDIAIIVQLKGAIGKIWDDLSKPPYKLLFNSGVTGYYTWKCVQISRKIENEVAVLEKSYSVIREQKIVRYGNRLIAGLVFKVINRIELNNPTTDVTKCTTDNFIHEATTFYTKEVVNFVQTEYSNAMIPSLFKNQTKSRHIYDFVSKLPLPEMKQSLKLKVPESN
jgi:hypothetical protein